MQTESSSHGGVILAILPLVTALVAVVLCNESPSLGFWITGVVGSVVIIIYALLHGAGSFGVGDFALLGAVLIVAVTDTVGGQLSKEMSGWQVICWALVISFPFIVIPAWIQFPADWLQIPVKIWLGFLYLALVSQFLGFFWWYKGLALGGISRVSQVQLIQPFITISASVLLLNETIDRITILFALLVVGIVAIGKRMPITQKT